MKIERERVGQCGGRYGGRAVSGQQQDGWVREVLVRWRVTWLF